MIELHCHLDGSITLDIAKKLAKLQGIKLPSENDEELEKLLSVPKTCESLTDFLKCFELPLSLLKTPEGLMEACKLILKKKAEEGLKYIELRFAPQLHCSDGFTQEDAVLSALEGIKNCDELYKIHCNLILCCMRGEKTHDANMETVLLAGKYLVEDGGVVALDLAGSEALFKTRDYGVEFEKARALGIPFTIHAGEADGWESVKCALDFGASRIGHGVRIEENPEVLKYVIDHRIPLEMCPNSNRQTKAVSDMKKYPFRKYLEEGVRVTVNTDDPAICRTTLNQEFEYLSLNQDEKRKVLKNAVEAAFTSRDVKDSLMKNL